MAKSDGLSHRIRSLLQDLTSNADPLSALARFSTAGGLTELADRLMALRQWLLSDLGSIEKSIAALLKELENGDPTLARQSAAHLLQRPGKRIRPMCEMLGS
jgi:hypothetical protein